MKDRIEIVASGFGGQGVVRLGQIIGETGVKQGLHVSMLKSHGTEMRGGYVRSQVVLSKDIIDSPMCESPDYFIALSKAAYDRFKDSVSAEGKILYDPDFVETLDDSLTCEHLAVPARALSIAHFKGPIFANTIILGKLAGILGNVLDKQTVLDSILEVIPKFHEQNKAAFQLGFDFSSE